MSRSRRLSKCEKGGAGKVEGLKGLKMRIIPAVCLSAALVLFALMPAAAATGRGGSVMENAVPGKVIGLPAPLQKSGVSLEEALVKRKSVRRFTPKPLSLGQISQLLWAGQGKNRPGFGRTAPSAGALYPLELFIVVKEGVFGYLPGRHQMAMTIPGDLRTQLAAASLGQGCVRDAPATIVISGVVERTAAKYGTRAERYMHMEAGHAAQNILLEAVALGLGGVPVGAFDDLRVKRLLGLPANHAPLYLIPVGAPAE